MIILDRRSILRGAATTVWFAGTTPAAFSQSRAETPRYVTGNNVNTLEPTTFGYKISEDGLSITIALRPDATWRGGSPVTVDVKWSLDRAVSAMSLAAPQFTIGSLFSADQSRIVGAHTIQVTLAKPDRRALSNLCVLYAMMINSKLAKQHATTEDPWA